LKDETEMKIEEKQEDKSDWYIYEDVAIHKGLFKAGIVAVVPEDEFKDLDGKDKLTDDSFFIKERLFYISSNKEKRQAKKVTRPYDLLQQIIDSRTANGSLYCPIQFNKNSSVIFSPQRKDEVFLTITLDGKRGPLKANQEEIRRGMRIYPWVSDNAYKFQPKKIRQFVTAGCIAGAKLQGLNQKNGAKGLIKHDIEFYPGEKIVGIKFSANAPNPYEKVLFSDLRMNLRTINAISDPDQETHLLYHLPYSDYLLFGIELFLRGRITLKALDKFINIILDKKVEHEKTIKELCTKHVINVDIQSPFDNLFNQLSSRENISSEILQSLNKPLTELENEVCEEQQVQNEKNLVQDCLKQLQTNDYNPAQREIWIDILKANPIEEIKNLEDLFKLANAVMIMMASKNKEHYEVCAIHPLSEKQIQVGYSTFCKKAKSVYQTDESPYPAILNITTFDSLLSYSAATKGQLFYLPDCSKTITDLVGGKKILRQARSNIGFFDQQNWRYGMSLKQIIGNPDLSNSRSSEYTLSTSDPSSSAPSSVSSSSVAADPEVSGRPRTQSHS
jgi:hypothetical protein